MNGTFVKNGNCPTSSQEEKKKVSGLSLDAFMQVLMVQGVCSLSMHNAPAWYLEIPQELMGAYVRKRDHRVTGALLHTEALQSVHHEMEIYDKHPFTL
ncbi:MAG: hypothetical protein ACI9H6_000755 [Patiriisocius sp.]|jgi:hypothetical protein